MKNRILIFVDYYLPGYKAGGPLRSVAGLVRCFAGEIDCFVVTLDRDAGDVRPYPIADEQWHDVGRSHVRYVNRSAVSMSFVRSLVEQVRPDVVYLNGYFGLMTRTVLAARRCSPSWRARTIVAAQGEFAAGALNLKPFKKRAYVLGAHAARLDAGIEWQASSVNEATEIERIAGPAARIHVASDLFTPICDDMPPKAEPKVSGRVRLLYLARIAPVKNLGFLTSLLHRVTGSIALTIVGPVDDEAYWRQCRDVMSRLPARIVVRHLAAQPHDRVLDLLVAHDFLVLPTLGENFGHTIVESLQAGLPVVVSDRTPWRQLTQAGSGWDLPFDADAWVRVLEHCVAMDTRTHDLMRLDARRHVSTILDRAIAQNRRMLMAGIGIERQVEAALV